MRRHGTEIERVAKDVLLLRGRVIGLAAEVPAGERDELSLLRQSRRARRRRTGCMVGGLIGDRELGTVELDGPIVCACWRGLATLQATQERGLACLARAKRDQPRPAGEEATAAQQRTKVSSDDFQAARDTRGVRERGGA